MSHTPGPWTIRDHNGVPKQIMGGTTDKDGHYNPVTRWGTTFIAPTSEEALANARLIAAAPELLETVILLRDNAAQLIGLNHSSLRPVNDLITKATQP